MDWDLAIERNRIPLLSLVVTLCAMIGLADGVTVERLSRPVYRKVLRLLRTAEAAVRRLIIVAARDIVVEPKPKRPARAEHTVSSKAKDDGTAKAETKGKARRKRGFLFKLFDPRKRFAWAYGRRRKRPRIVPRIRVIDVAPDEGHPVFRLFPQPEPPPTPPAPVVEEKVPVDDGTVNAAPLIRRLMAIVDALQDIPRQALRYARWRDQPYEERRPQLWTPLRPGRPPGHRERHIHEVDEILKECHWLARNVHPEFDDTS